MPRQSFWASKRVLLTGQTGFKGSWLMAWLQRLGAEVHGMALAPDTAPSLYLDLRFQDAPGHFLGDIRDAALVRRRVSEVRPDVVFHLAAQPLVLRSYDDPLETWGTNVLGTAHVLDALRPLDNKMAIVVITTDKVYENTETGRAYEETDRLGGHDPYSASKAACELVVDSYRRSFLASGSKHLASARAGNVIGGGDWARDRIVPDIARALASGTAITLRNPDAVRPWQHVLDPLAGYLKLVEDLWDRPDLGTAFNFGPDPAGIRSVRDLVELAIQHWPGTWQDASEATKPHEAGRLSLSIEKAQRELGWQPVWDFDQSVAQTIDWYQRYAAGVPAAELVDDQISQFEKALS
jgi:CDP-glucose 4,6-dehydratase